METLLQSPVTLVLLAANIVLSTIALGNVVILDKLALHIARIRSNHELYRLISSAFVHVGPLHLFVNMYALYMFGPAFERGLGVAPFLALYFGSLLGSSALEWLEHFRNPNYRSVGASGALSGLSLAFAMFAPMAEISLFFVFPMPMFVFAIVYLAVSIWASTTGALPGVAHSGHLGGALAGIALVCILYPHVPQQMIDEIIAGTRGWI